MKKALLVVSALVLGSVQAKADGFECLNLNEDLKIKLYHHVTPEFGTRNAAVMVLSNPTIEFGRKTIATFSDADLLLSNEASRYYAKVDLRFATSNRAGELIAGTKLGELKNIVVSVDHKYGDGLIKGETVSGSAELYKRNGDVVEVPLTCDRYLKN